MDMSILHHAASGPGIAGLAPAVQQLHQTVTDLAPSARMIFGGFGFLTSFVKESYGGMAISGTVASDVDVSSITSMF